MSGARVMDGDWRLFSDDPMMGVQEWFLQVDEKHFAIKTVYYETDKLLDLNQQRANDSIGKRWGDGQVAASIPMNLFFDKLGEAVQANDQAYIKRFLNDPDNARLRTFGGSI